MPPIVHGIDLGRIEERGLQYPGGEVDGVGLGVLVRVYGGGCHPPFLAVDRLAELGHPALDLEARRAGHVAEEVASPHRHRGVVAPAVGVGDLVDLGVQLRVGHLLGLLGHPLQAVDVLVQCGVDGFDHLNHPGLALGGEVPGHVGLPHGLSQIGIGVDRAAAPTGLKLLGPGQLPAEEIEVLREKRLAQEGRHRV